MSIKDFHGVLRSAAHLSDQERIVIANRRNYLTRSEIALDVAAAYPGGDYFEFGSTGLCTFCSFLGAFQIYHSQTKHFPSTRFYAFDIFGNPDQGSGAPEGQRAYFEAWRNEPDVAAPLAMLDTYSDLRDRCELVPGYFQDTLSDALKAKMRAEKRRIGFAFLDVNTPWSYKIVFDFLIDVIGYPEKMFIYLDEYFTDPPVPVQYQMFCDEAKRRYGTTSIYMRNAGNFGALFCLMPPPLAEYDSLFPNNERLR